MPSFLSITRETKPFLEENLKIAAAVVKDATRWHSALAQKSVALLFEKASTRTRVAFELAGFELGAHVSFLSFDSLQLSSNESLEDTARVLGTQYSVLVFRGYNSSTLLVLDRYSKAPVINALTNDSHPSQALTDLYTILEHFGSFDGLRLSFIGDAKNNVALSLTKICLLFGIHVTLCAPPGYLPDRNFPGSVWDFDEKALALTNNPATAAAGADIVYTDTWTSMNQLDEREQREESFRGYQVNFELMQQTNNAVFMHCLPANREKEVSNEVIDSDKSLVWKQAENKKLIAKTLLITCI